MRQAIPILLILLLTAGLLACASAPVVTPEGLDPQAWETVEQLDLPAHRAQLKRDGFGQVVVSYADLEGDTLGRASYAGKNPCRPRVEIDPDAPPNVLAHEMGHTLLLQHAHHAPHSIMHPRTDGKSQIEIVPEQRYLMQAGAQLLRICRRAYDRKQRKKAKD